MNAAQSSGQGNPISSQTSRSFEKACSSNLKTFPPGRLRASFLQPLCGQVMLGWPRRSHPDWCHVYRPLLLSAARTLSLRDIYAAGEEAATFCKLRWHQTNGQPAPPNADRMMPTRSRRAISLNVETRVAVTSSRRPAAPSSRRGSWPLKKTPKSDLDLARKRLKDLKRG